MINRQSLLDYKQRMEHLGRDKFNPKRESDMETDGGE